MTKIYVLTSEPKGYEDVSYVMNVFSSYDLALTWVNTHHPTYVHVGKSKYGQESFHIEEYELDAD